MVGCCSVSLNPFESETVWKRKDTDRFSGAVYRGLEGNQVQNRKARCHYGVRHYATFDSTLHDQKDRVWDDYEEKWTVQNRMTWYVGKVGNALSMSTLNELP